ncbi:MAG: hypothetical protein RL013_2869 [Bacteroidota bacterium]|jgi:trigger factor
MPTVVRQDLDNTSAILKVTITREDLKPKLDAELKKFRQRVPLKGFRPGQAPVEHVKKLYGASIFADALNDMVSEELYGYLRESNLDILGQPLPVDSQEKFSFKISNPDPEYVVSYEIGFVPDYDLKGLDKSFVFERLEVSNLDELAQEDLDYARRRMGKTSEVDDTIQENDMIKIAARELDGDSVKEGGLETTMSFLVKSIANEDVKTQLLGMKAGDTLRFNARSLEGYEKEDMYRKYVLNLDPSDKREVGDMFEGTIESVSRLQEAEMDEEFFKNYFNNDTITTPEAALEELKKGIRRFYDTRADAVLMRKLQDHLMDLNKVDLPEKFLKRWLAATNKGELSEAQIEDEFPAFAENLRWTIIRDDIKKRYSIEVTDEDIREAFTQKLRNYFSFEMPAHLLDSTINRMMENKKDVEETQRDIELEKLFTAIRDQVSITEKPVSSAELHEIVDSLNAAAKKEQQPSEIAL